MLAKWIKYENKRQTSQKETKNQQTLYAKILNVIENNKYKLVGVAMKFFVEKLYNFN